MDPLLTLGRGNLAAVQNLACVSVQLGALRGPKPELHYPGGFLTWTGHNPTVVWPGWNPTAVPTLLFSHL